MPEDKVRRVETKLEEIALPKGMEGYKQIIDTATYNVYIVKMEGIEGSGTIA
jgi:hypothetical protein